MGHANDQSTRSVSIFGPGLMIGVGLGGFVDGILLHQILQWHHMLSATDSDNIGISPYPVDTVYGLEVNTLWDGMFHATTWLFVAVGIFWLWRRVTARRGPWSRTSLVGLFLAGWGLFNLVEGIIDHHLLAIHHVRAGPNQAVYDAGFLVLGALLLLGGLAIHRAATR